jgi:coenzyme PQQ biosynthesis probable peptidase PqqF
MTLSLTGPQGLDELRAMAKAFGAVITQGEKALQHAPIPLMDAAKKSYQQVGERRWDCLFTFEALPDPSSEALAFLCHWLNAAKPGGLLAKLQDRGMADSLKAAPLYQFAGQAVLHIEFTLPANATPTGIREQLTDWLGFFAAQQDWSGLRNEYATLQQRQQQVSSALQLAQRDSEQREDGLSGQGIAALKEILKQIGAVDNFTGQWQLPTPNPFLRADEPLANAGLIRGQTSAHRGLRTFAQDRSRGRRERSSMQFSQVLPGNTDEGAIYLRWRLDAAPDSSLQSSLENYLQPLREDARQAGVDFSFSTIGNEWLLKLTGLQEPMPSVLEHALSALTNPDAGFPRVEPTSPALIPIRQLLKALPEHCLGCVNISADLQQLWSSARWDGLAVGLSAQTQAAMGVALSRIPGVTDNQLTPPPSINLQHLWHTIDTGSSEHALLLFCPTATQEIPDEAAWRLLAHLSQTPFYERLRVELQLGYAVFSGLRQINGQTGLLFGVQSPNVATTDVLKHIEHFLSGLADGIDEATYLTQRQALADQFNSATLPDVQAAELLWQAKLAGHPSDYLTQLADAILKTDRNTLLAAAQRLNNAEGGWRCLASEACPGAPWQAAK